MSAFPTNWTLYVEKAGITITAQAVFEAGNTGESGTVTAVGPKGTTYSGTWSETPQPTGNQITFSLTPNGTPITLQFSGVRVLYAMGGPVMSGNQIIAGWSACSTPSNTANQELDEL